MVRYLTGDLFSSPAQVITNTVNCVGVMGAGLALEFKKRWPKMYDDYKARCERGEVIPGQPYLYEDGEVQILNFPTKRHWKENSLINDIEDGLKYLAINHAEMGVFFLALPPLGCGLGGLNWPEVKTLIDKHLGAIEGLEVLVYEPSATGIKTSDSTRDTQIDNSGSGIAAQPNP